MIHARSLTGAGDGLVRRWRESGLAFYLIAFAMATADGNNMLALPLAAKSLGVSPLGAGSLGAIGSLFYVAACIAVGPLVERLTPKRIMLFGATGALLGYVACCFCTTLPQLQIVVAIKGLASGAASGKRRGVMMAVHETLLAAGFFTGTLGGGYMASGTTNAAIYPMGAAVALVAALLLGGWSLLHRPRGRRT